MKKYLILIILFVTFNNVFANTYMKIYIMKNDTIIYVRELEYKDINITNNKKTEIWYDNKDLYINEDINIRLNDRNISISIKGEEVWIDNIKMNSKNILINKNKVIDGGFINEFE